MVLNKLVIVPLFMPSSARSKKCLIRAKGKTIDSVKALLAAFESDKDEVMTKTNLFKVLVAVFEKDINL